MGFGFLVLSKLHIFTFISVPKSDREGGLHREFTAVNSHGILSRFPRQYQTLLVLILQKNTLSKQGRKKREIQAWVDKRETDSEHRVNKEEK